MVTGQAPALNPTKCLFLDNFPQGIYLKLKRPIHYPMKGRTGVAMMYGNPSAFYCHSTFTMVRIRCPTISSLLRLAVLAQSMVHAWTRGFALIQLIFSMKSKGYPRKPLLLLFLKNLTYYFLQHGSPVNGNFKPFVGIQFVWHSFILSLLFRTYFQILPCNVRDVFFFLLSQWTS